MHLVFILVFTLALLAIGFAVALTARGRAATATRTSRLRTFDVGLTPDEAFARLTAMPEGTYRVDDRDPATRVLVMSSRPTGFTWGFLYPIFISERDRGARVEVGIKSRFIQVGPLVTRAHDQVMAAIEDHLTRAR